MNNFNEYVAKKIDSFPSDKIAFCFDEQSISFGTLSNEVDRYANHLLAMGVKPGTGVGYSMPNGPELMYLFLAIARVGAYAVPLFHAIPDPAKAGIFARR